MSLYGMMRTSVSGMQAQSNRLGTVADNIANSSTTGYKRSSTEFSSLILPGTKGSYTSGGVTTAVRQYVTDQGILQYTNSGTDLAINGEGFFVVQDAAGNTFLTRSGAFVPDDEGYLVNAAGYRLMAYSYANGDPVATANGFEGLEPVRITDTALTAMPSANGYISANLPFDAAVGDSERTSVVAYDNVGAKVMLDVVYTKTGANTWEVEVLNRDGGASLGTQTLTFDPANGQLAGTSPTSIAVAIPNGSTLTLDLSVSSELATEFTLLGAVTDGSPPSTADLIEIASDGTISAQYSDGSFIQLYKIPLATVASPDNLRALPGNVYSQSSDSGVVQMGFAEEGSLGSIISGALENSNVDIAEELTAMIEAQRSYTANSKVFQTGSELMDILVNLKR